MTKLLKRAFAEASELPESEQEPLSSLSLGELAAEDDFTLRSPRPPTSSRNWHPR